MWWIIGIVVYILSFFAIWLFIIQEAKDEGELFETVQDLLDVLEREEIGYVTVLSLIPILNTVSSIILGLLFLLGRILRMRIN
jgi:hypothetical protein